MSPWPRRRCGPRCVLDARASLGECPVWSAWPSRCSTGSTSTRRRSTASIRRTGRNTAMPMPESIGCFALRRDGGFVVALRDGIWLARADGTLERKVADAPYDPAHHRFNDGRCDPQGRFFAGYMNERRDAATAALVRLDPDCRADGGPRRHDDQQRPRVQPGRPHDVPHRHADADDPRLRLRRATGDARRAARVRALRAAGDRPDGGAVDRDGCYWTALYRGGKVVRIAPDGRSARRVSRCRRCARRCARSAAPTSGRST